MRKIIIDPVFCLGFALATLLLPLRLVLAWFLAVSVHELSHYLALKFCKVDIHDVKISASGAAIRIGNICGWKEIVCALAGPVGGLSLLLLSRWLPCTAVCGLLHSCYNLLPIFSLDGGRALRTALVKIFGLQTGERMHCFISSGIIIVLAGIGLYLCLRFNITMLLVGLLGSLLVIKFVRKFPCKPHKQIVQ